MPAAVLAPRAVHQHQRDHAGFIDACLENLAGTLAIGQKIRARLAQRGEQQAMVWLVVDRGDIRDQQALDAPGVIERRLHRDLAPHGVPDQRRPCNAGCVHQSQHIRGHQRVIHFRCLKRAPVIAQVRHQHPVITRQFTCQRSKIR